MKTPAPSYNKGKINIAGFAKSRHSRLSGIVLPHKCAEKRIPDKPE
jgi:hypothetical protein